MAFSQARVKRDNFESVFWFSSRSSARSSARSLARPSVRPPFVSGRRSYCLCVCVKARGGGSNIAISAAAIPLPFFTIRSLQSFPGFSSSVWFDFLKILYVLDIMRRRFSFMCWLVFFQANLCMSQRCCRGLLSDRFHFVFQDLKDLLIDSIFS